MNKSINYAGYWILLEGCINNNKILNPYPKGQTLMVKRFYLKKKVSGRLETFFRYPPPPPICPFRAIMFRTYRCLTIGLEIWLMLLMQGLGGYKFTFENGSTA